MFITHCNLNVILVLFIDLIPLFFHIMDATSVLLEPDIDNTAEVLDVPRALTVISYSQVTGVYRRTDSYTQMQNWNYLYVGRSNLHLKTKYSFP